MDSTRKPLGVVGMVHGDYGMFKRWYDYYAAQVGAENLFVFSHGNDPHHRTIAPGANIINAPRDPSMYKWDTRRWRMMGDFASGMLNFYNWMLVTDIDEMVVVDPNIAPGLVPYLSTAFDGMPLPPSISPLGLNIVHLPDEEPDSLDSLTPVLSQRRFFYPSRVYSKPTLISTSVQFGPGGHRNDHGRRKLSDALYLVHLNLADASELEERAGRKVALIDVAVEQSASSMKAHVWRDTMAAYLRVREDFERGPEDVALPQIRTKMVEGQTERYRDRFVWGQFENDTLYTLPKRFSGLV
jgi:hypothetical protein